MEKIGPIAIQDKLVPTLTTLTSDKIWRIRLAVIEFMVTLVRFVDKDIFCMKLQDVIVNMLQDPVFAIREETANSLIALAKSEFD